METLQLRLTAFLLYKSPQFIRPQTKRRLNRVRNTGLTTCTHHNAVNHQLTDVALSGRGRLQLLEFPDFARNTHAEIAELAQLQDITLGLTPETRGQRSQ